ncbi:Tyrosyl-tRNA synthetase [Giardia duodenalis assemblage B]|uniref:Tyrosyl-tRNA synthetase n=2 Tax=Giardia intestinalis TaxID=5741 RepID=A0A132NXW1_GIAIN|nr:Tyrosyl-tRNA synthetase [Giardia intestinalis]KWX14909.1 Tyrosyl-tRNA synthetase [Giardia intestinalis assemblage B]
MRGMPRLCITCPAAGESERLICAVGYCKGGGAASVCTRCSTTNS